MKLVHFLIFYHQRLITCQIRLVSVCLKARNQSQQRLKSLFVGADWVRHQINLPSCFPYVVYLLFLGGGRGNMGALWFVSPRHRSNVFLRRRGRKLNSCQSQVNNGDCKYLHIDNTTCLQCLWGRDSRVYWFGCVFPVRALIIVNMFYTFEWHFSISFGRPL